MPLRLAEIIVPSDVADEVETVFEEQDVPLIARSELAGGRTRLETLCSVQRTEGVLDALHDRFGHLDALRVILVAVEATLPRSLSWVDRDDERDEDEAPDDGKGLTDSENTPVSDAATADERGSAAADDAGSDVRPTRSGDDIATCGAAGERGAAGRSGDSVAVVEPVRTRARGTGGEHTNRATTSSPTQTASSPAGEPRPSLRSISQAEADDAGATDEAVGDSAERERSTSRIYREEVFNALDDAARWSSVYVATLILSTVVAIVGLIQSSTAVIIGAMVIAPLLGPNMALALGTTLGDRRLATRGLLTGAGGLVIGLVLSVGTGLAVSPDLTVPEIAMRTQVDLPDVVLALASGAAGALAFTTGAPAALIGVMVAVALMPPLVVFGLVLATGDLTMAWGAGMLLFTNIISVNLAATVVFRVQGLTPRDWWENTRARRTTAIATTIWALLLAALIVVIVLTRARGGG